MDRTQAPQPAQSSNRDTMFCHECQDEWYRDEHGLTCPECGSDFTEIIEDNNDPRDQHMYDRDDSDGDDDASTPSLEEPPPHNHPLLAGHNPWRDHDDPEEGDISNLQFRQIGPGRFSVSATMYRTVSPTDLRHGAGATGAMGGFAQMLNSIIGGGRAQNQDQTQGQNQGQTQGTQGEGQDQNTGETRGPTMGLSGSGVLPGGHRFTYTNARLYPRDAENPGPRVEPVDELNNVLVGLMAAFGEPPGGHHHHHAHHHHHGPVPGRAGGDGSIHDAGDFNPLMALISQMVGGNGQFGDAVYSQEALDRIISQLMDQTATGNAPGPATQSDIDSLPRKPVSVEMLGTEGRAECSICMDEVNIGEEVTELPCHHWFHHQCISAWLGEHDTCPHCRKGITKEPENGEEAQQGQSHQSTEAGGQSATPANRQMPGSFEATGDGTSDNPFMVPSSPASSPARARTSNPNQNAQAGATESDTSGDGFTERFRRGLFGSQ